MRTTCEGWKDHFFVGGWAVERVWMGMESMLLYIAGVKCPVDAQRYKGERSRAQARHVWAHTHVCIYIGVLRETDVYIFAAIASPAACAIKTKRRQ